MARNPARWARSAAYALITPAIWSGFSAARAVRNRAPAEADCGILSTMLKFPRRTGALQHPLSRPDYRSIDHLTIQGKRASAGGLVLRGRFNDAQCMRDGFLTWTERLLDGRNLVGMDNLFSNIGHARALLR